MKSNLNRQLRFEFIRRSTFGSLFHVAISIAMWIVFDSFNPHPWWWSVALVLAGSSGLIRFLTRRNFNENSRLPHRSENVTYVQHVTLLFIAVACWGLVSSYSIHAFGVYSLESLTLIFVTCTLLSGAINTLAPAANIQKLYITSMIFPPCLTIFSEAKEKHEIAVGVVFLFYWGALWGLAKIQSEELLQHLRSKNRLIVEKDKIQQIFNSVPGFVFAINEKNLIQEKSADLSYLLGGSFETLSTGDLVGLADSSLIKAVNEFRISKISSATQELELLEDGASYWYMVSMTKNSGLANEIVVVGIPIRELKEAQEMLKIQTSKAEYSSRLATLGEMAGGIAHEVNNPLAVILGSAAQIERMLTQTPIPSEAIKTKASKIISTSQRIGKIIQGLRYFSRQGERDPFNPTPMKQLIEDTLELCREKFYSHGVNLLIEPVPEVEVPARAVQLSQVLLNLLNNAFDALQKVDEKFVEIKFKKTADKFSIFISNSGPTIPDAIAERIFVPFFTTKEIGKGTGLGLSISKGILGEHEGELILRRDMPLTTFEIVLPLERKEAISNKNAA